MPTPGAALQHVVAEMHARTLLLDARNETIRVAVFGRELIAVQRPAVQAP
jgi:hypothetical protein